MEKEFVPYKQTLQLLKLGLKIEPLMYYTHGSTNIMPGTLMKNKIAMAYNMTELQINMFYVPAPLYQQAFRWFREKYNLHVEIVLNPYGRLSANINTLLNDSHGKRFITNFDNICYEDTYEKAEMVCLEELIKIVENG